MILTSDWSRNAWQESDDWAERRLVEIRGGKP